MALPYNSIKISYYIGNKSSLVQLIPTRYTAKCHISNNIEILHRVWLYHQCKAYFVWRYAKILSKVRLREPYPYHSKLKILSRILCHPAPLWWLSQYNQLTDLPSQIPIWSRVEWSNVDWNTLLTDTTSRCRQVIESGYWPRPQVPHSTTRATRRYKLEVQTYIKDFWLRIPAR